MSGWTIRVCWLHAQRPAVLGVVRATAVDEKAFNRVWGFTRLPGLRVQSQWHVVMSMWGWLLAARH